MNTMLAAVAFTNLLFNTAMEGDGLGGTLGWEPWKQETTIAHLTEKGPDGEPAFRLTMPVLDYFMQHDLKLVEGEEYEAGLWVRTNNLKKPFRFLHCNLGWQNDAYSPDFPLDTAGGWEKVEWRFKAVRLVTSYRFAITGKGDAEGPLDFSGLYLRPVTEKALAGSGRLLTPKRIPARIVPIDPLLNEISRSQPEVEFHFNGDLAGNADEYEFAASFDSGKTKATAPLGANRRGRVAFKPFAKAWERRFTLDVAVMRKGDGTVVWTNRYAVVLDPPPPAGPAGRKLNNFVTELYAGDAADGEVKFFNPKKGWVFIGLDGGDIRTRVSLGDIDVPIIRWREGELYETMRYLDAGWKTLRLEDIAKNTRLRVHTVKRIVHAAPCMQRGMTDLWRWTTTGRYWKSDFTKRYLFPFLNTASFYGQGRNGERNLIENAYYEERGFRIESIICINPRDLVRNDMEKARQWLLNHPYVKQSRAVTIDESGIACTTRDARANFAEAYWETADSSAGVNNFYCDSTGAIFTDPTTQSTELAAAVNSGRGDGMLYMEAYVAAHKDPEAAHAYEDHFLKLKRSVGAITPCAENRIVWYLGTFLEPGAWTDWAEPEADIKVLYTDLLRRIATDPGFADPGGVAAGHYSFTDDDVARWLSKMVRYYCIEGGTGNPAAERGFAYLPGIVKNADFAEGLAGWQAEGDVQAHVVAGYGKKQGRQKIAQGVGDNVARFVRGDSPNRLSQRLSGLVPGQYYHIHFVAADEEDLNKPYAITNGTFLARGVISDGGEAVPELCGVHVLHDRMEKRKGRIYFANVMMVFKATANEATYTITDWAADDRPGAEKGRRTLVNFVNARKYYLENDEELEFLKARGRESAR